MTTKYKTTQACNLIIFGTKGDLAKRKLLPSLYQLEKIKLIHPQTRIIGVGRANWNINFYIHIVYEALERFVQEPINTKFWNILKKRLDFCNLDVNEIKYFNQLKKKINKKNKITISYLAMPPTTFGIICKGLNKIGLNNEPNRIVMEKPIGSDLKSSQKINNQVSKYFLEKQIYRIDHYLGKETILNLLTLRFANPIFISNWDNRSIDHVQITVAEDIGIEKRWKYFDNIGQLRDMVQSHLLQILTIITMSPPINLMTDSIRNEKIKILKALRPINHINVKNNTVRGQYTTGYIKGKRICGYLEEEGIKYNSHTETFVSIKVDIDNWQWSGVPFYLRTGKRLSDKYSEIVIYFKNTTFNLFKNSYKELPKNKLTIRIQPNGGIDLQIINKLSTLNHKHNLQCNTLNLNFTEKSTKNKFLEAYERLLLDTMRGMQTLFVRRDEVEEAWKWIDSIIKAWKINSKTKIKPYQAGSTGPEDSNNMIKKDKRVWNKYNKNINII
ncbi:Glucose-6-phosphate 1-dehydrogenase [Candidatus Westeberhardia cardiocondylae]|uniref:Glucose-6-phosphate 1-dehydrogenase n=1 Tax=Candidatus Westeberhardia cardiocondylae TaxID=1594731 RepID=A0A0H5C5I4_9ENTR|nr:glucose-6-phosphate dehydrogenase [Candidatus Westeberhardia cardiocondylae]MCR3756386.1 NADP(+)-dependent glucose-6-phosphate dehydrogenase [Candidatus Westeberhardia cardiocondylae]CEN32221.1 Glucose-6-phosphate 1-dehydrogenase [Candidatus Westeberhardia cardiocondylae]